MTGGHYRTRMKFAAEEGKKLLELSERIANADAERGKLLERLDRMEEQISHITREVEELNRSISKKTIPGGRDGGVKAPAGEEHL